LGELRRNDRIGIETPAGHKTYRVLTTKITGPGDVSVLENSAGYQLTLITCYPFHWIGPAPQRFIVTASVPANRRARAAGPAGPISK
jgi:sortase A